MSRGDIKAGGAYVELMMRDKGFAGGLAKARQQLAGFAKGAAAVGAGVVLAGAAMVGAGLKAFISTGSAIADMSARTGLSVESLSELQHAAQQAGASAGDLESALRTMAKKGLDPKQFDQIAAGIAGIEDPGERARVAMETFGKSGAKLLPMLGDLQSLRKEAQDLGLVMSGEAAASADRLGDGFDNLWATLKMGLFAVGAAVAPFVEIALPVIQSFATGALLAIQSAGDFIRSNVGAVTTFVNDTWQAVLDFAGPIFNAYRAMIVESWTAVWEITTTVWNNMLSIISSVWGGVQESTGGVMQWLQDTIIGALSAISFAYQNWRSMVMIAITGVELGVVRFANQVVYFFGTVMPAWLDWLGEHWHEVFIDMGNLVATVAGNIWTNLKNLWDAVKGLFSGEGFEFDFTPLTEGFESAITELPAIAEREMGPLEKSLQDELDGLLDGVGAKWEDHSKKFAKRVESFAATSPDAAAAMGGPKGAAAAMEAAAIAGFVPKTDKAKNNVSTNATTLTGGREIKMRTLTQTRQAVVERSDLLAAENLATALLVRLDAGRRGTVRRGVALEASVGVGQVVDVMIG